MAVTPINNFEPFYVSMNHLHLPTKYNETLMLTISTFVDEDREEGHVERPSAQRSQAGRANNSVGSGRATDGPIRRR